MAAQIRRGRLTLDQAKRFVGVYEQIPIQLVDVSLGAALEIAEECGIYAYSEARRRFAAILDEARSKGSVVIRRREARRWAGIALAPQRG